MNQKYNELDTRLKNLILDSANDSIFLHDSEGNFIYVNEAAYKTRGYTKKELMNINLHELDAPEYSKMIEPRIKDIIEKGWSTFESAHQRKDGSIIPVEINVRIIESEDRKLFLSIARDITERKKAEKELKEVQIHLEKTVKERTQELTQTNKKLQKEINERKEAEVKTKQGKQELRVILDSSNESIFLIDVSGIIIDANEATANRFGIKKSDMIGNHIKEFIPSDTFKSRWKYFEKAFKIKKIVEFEDERNGIFFHHFISPVSEDGKVNKLAVFSKDITESKMWEEQIKLQNATLEGINKIFEKTIAVESEAKVAQEALALCEKITGSKFGFILERNLKGKLDAIAISDPGWKECLMEESNATVLLKDMEEHGVHGKASRDGISVLTNNPSSHEDSVGTPIGHPELHSFLGVPLKHTNKVLGSIGLGNKEGGYTLKDQEIIEKISFAISESLLRNRAENALKEALNEKKMLLKEIHHRVKNNLMIISSLLNLQSGYIKDEESKGLFLESEDRARSMALIHERLYESTDLKNIDFGDHIQTLVNELFHTYSNGSGCINLKINAENLGMDINTTIPLSLILNELVTNSLKYAFPEDKTGEIEIDFHSTKDEYQLTVKDNGIGLPKDLDYTKTDSLGLQLVTNLTKQINGEIELDRTGGTKFKITFPKPKEL